MPSYGAHVGGGLLKCVPKALKIGAECIQIFASAPQTWREPAHSDANVDAFRQALSESSLTPTVLHAIYLINPASPDPAIVERSVSSIASHLIWAGRFGALGLVVHLGSSLKRPVEEAIGQVAEKLKEALGKYDGDAMLLLETCAGQGNTIGRKFDDLGFLISQIGDERVGVCLDTCHVYAAGYDITSPEGLAFTVSELERTVGLDRLKVIHVNDSKGALGSNIDRHDNIGQGNIGEVGFELFINHPAFTKLPLILEVPGYDGEGPDSQNLDTLRRLTHTSKGRRSRGKSQLLGQTGF